MLCRSKIPRFGPVRVRVNRGLVGHWVGGGAGGTWFDRTPNRNHGTLTNGPTWRLGPGGKQSALAFDGTNDYVEINSTVLTSGATSVAYWYSYTSGNFYTGDLLIAAANGTFLASSDTQQVFAVRGATVSAYRDALSLGNGWNHVAFTYNGAGTGTLGNYAIYVNGASVTVITAGAQGGATVSNQIAREGGAPSTYSGKLADFRIYNRALSAAEAALIYKGDFVPIRTIPRWLVDVAAAAPAGVRGMMLRSGGIVGTA